MSRQSRPKIGPGSFNRFDENTLFHIDFDWWEQSGLDLKTYLTSRLQLGGDVPLNRDVDEVDLVDPKSGEVRRVDGFQYMLQTYFKQLPDDFIRRTSLVDAVFCVLLGNANQPMTVRELAERLQRESGVLLKTLSGGTVYLGMRPVREE